MDSRDKYLSLLIKAVTNYLYLGEAIPEASFPQRSEYYGPDGWKLPPKARPLTGCSIAQLRSLRALAEQLIDEKIPGDFVEAGVWRGGAALVLAGVLETHNVADRQLWLVDTFEGIPNDDRDVARNDPVVGWQDRWIGTRPEVEQTFDRFSLLNDRLGFVEGEFKDTLPGPVQRISLLRLDADTYSATTDALTSLYPSLSVGGYLIIDDWHLPGCREAVVAYRKMNNINDKILGVYRAGSDDVLEEIFWRKS